MLLSDLIKKLNELLHEGGDAEVQVIGGDLPEPTGVEEVERDPTNDERVVLRLW